MILLKKTIALFIFVFLTFASYAQDATDKIEMAGAMRASGKIYVVVAVLVIIFIGIVVYLVIIDRKVAKLEKEITNDKE